MLEFSDVNSKKKFLGCQIVWGNGPVNVKNQQFYFEQNLDTTMLFVPFQIRMEISSIH